MKIDKRLSRILLLLVAIFIFAVLLFGITYKTTFSDMPYPAKIEKVNYEYCSFTISYSSNNPKSTNYGKYHRETRHLYKIGKLSKESCKCVEDALKFKPKGVVQFSYVDYPYYSVNVKDNKFNIDVEVKNLLGTKIVNFNNIVKNNKNNLCQKWNY